MRLNNFCHDEFRKRRPGRVLIVWPSDEAVAFYGRAISPCVGRSCRIEDTPPLELKLSVASAEQQDWVDHGKVALSRFRGRRMMVVDGDRSLIDSLGDHNVMSRIMLFTFMALSVAMMSAQNSSLGFCSSLGNSCVPMEYAYNENESELAAACAALECPHPYWHSRRSRTHRGGGLTRLRRKRRGTNLEPHTHETNPSWPSWGRSANARRLQGNMIDTHGIPTTAQRWCGAAVAGAHFFVIHITREQRRATGAVFESSDGERLSSRPRATVPQPNGSPRELGQDPASGRKAAVEFSC
jgi:hypothetical protein